MNQKDLTQGPVLKTMSLFAFPLILGNLLQQGYNVVDTWVVGKFVGPDALAAVGSAFALMTFLTSILLGLCMGSGVVFSVCFGKKDEEALKNSIAMSFLLTAVITAILTTGALLSVNFIMAWMNIPIQITDMMRVYLAIVFCGIPAVFLYNFFSSYLKSIGNSVIPLVFLGIATAVNILLDLLFVAKFQRGTLGAAEATVLAQYLSGAGIAVYVFIKHPTARAAFRQWKFKKSSLKEIAGYSVLTCIQQSVMNFGILMVQGIVNSFGTAVMAAFAAAVKIDSFAYMTAQEYANAFSTFIAQNMGAGKKERIKKGIRYASVITISYCVLVSLVMWFAAGWLMRIFVDASETAIIAEGIRYLHIEGAFYCGIGILFLFYGLYRAVGKPFMSVVLTVISLGTRVLLSYVLSAIPTIGVVGIWWSIPIGWVLADLVGFLYYRKNAESLCKERDSLYEKQNNLKGQRQKKLQGNSIRHF